MASEIEALVIGGAGSLIWFAFAGFVLWAGPRRPVSQALAAYAAFWGINYVAGNVSIASGFTNAVAGKFGDATAYSLPFLYLLFVGHAVQSPLARPLRNRWMQGALVAIVVGLTAACALMPPPGLVLQWPIVFLSVWIALFTYGVVAAFDAWRRATPGTPTRGRMGSYLLAFGIFDAGYLLIQGSRLVLLLTGHSILEPPWWLEFLYSPYFDAVLVLLHVPLVFLGMFRHQLFDIDIKIKAGLRRATIVGIFALVFLGASQAAGAVIASATGSLYVGLAATGLLMLAYQPIRRLATGLADRIMPAVTADRSYLERRKVEVYQSALVEAAQQGPVRAEEARLADLRARLGLTKAQHEAAALALKAAQAASPRNPEVWERYEIRGELGRGGFGIAVLAHDRLLDRPVVLKQPLAALDEGAHQRVLQEARTAAQVRHPNVVTIYEVHAETSPPAIVMEYVPGGSLASLLSGPPLPLEPGMPLLAGILAGLEAVHTAGLVHRDLKPLNILLDASGIPKIADFGLALQGMRPDDPRTLELNLSGQAGASYMSPEQARGEEPGVRSDLYSAGAIMYHMLAGRPYLLGSTITEPDVRHLVQVQEPGLPLPFLPAHINALLAKALQKDPERRFGSAAEMLGALEPPRMKRSKAPARVA